MRLYTHVADCEKQLIEELDAQKHHNTFRTSFRDSDAALVIRLGQDLQLQAEDATSEEEVATKMFQRLTETLSQAKESTTGKDAWLLDLLENFFQIVYWTRRCKTKQDYLACIGLSFKLITGKSVSGSVWTMLDLSNLQDDMFTKLTRDAREFFTVSTTMLSNPLVAKLRKVYTFLLVQGFLKQFGKELTTEEFLRMDAKTKIDYKDKTSLVMTIVETAITICERVDAYRLTGDWRALIHDDATYTTWLKTADRLISLAPFTSNLAAHGTTYFTFVADLNDAIEKGEAICKYSQKNSGVESTGMRKKLSTLQLLKNVEITRRASQKERKAPFGVLIHGASSVGKSTFTKMLFYYYGKVHGLDIDDHFRYVRNPMDEYWSNFDSSKWCIQMDDIAFLDAKKSSDVDMTLKDMLNVVNNVPYVPPQAALEDKGKTPVQAELVLATTNTPDLNAVDYFQCPLAVRRRLPYVINIQPKDEYLHENGKFLDPKKLPVVRDAFPNFWKITVQMLEPVDHNGKDSATLKNVVEFTDVGEFLKHFAEASKQHKGIQEKSDTCDVHMRDVKVCPLCLTAGADCECVQGWIIAPMWKVVFSYLAACVADVFYRLFIHFLTIGFMAYFMKMWGVRWVLLHVGALARTELQFRIFGIVNAAGQTPFRVSLGKLVQITTVIGTIYVSYKAATYTSRKIDEHNAKERAARAAVPVEECDLDDEEELPDAWNRAEETHVIRSFDIGGVKVRSEKKFSQSISVDDSGATTPADDVELQGNIFGTTEEQLAKEESRNVWYNPTLELSQFDVPIASQSLAHLTPEQLRDLLGHNCVKVEVTALDATFATRSSAVFLAGQFLCMNRHVLRLGSRFKMRIITTTQSQGVSPNAVVYFDRSELREIPGKDISVLRVRDVPPRKNILKWWNETQIPVSHMVSIRRETTGEAVCSNFYNVSLYSGFPIEALGVQMDVYLGAGAPTKVGDCGSLGVALTPRGPVILGIHIVGHGTTAGFLHVTRAELQALCDSDEPVISGEGSPVLSLNAEVALVPPHHKSVVRYLPEGTVDVFGTLPGFRQRPKSRVCATPLQEQMLEHFDIEVGHDKPVMTGWEPVYNNVVEMVKPHTDIDHKILDHCVEQFTKDIIEGLNAEHGDEWKKELMRVSDRAAVNGIPGVKFIDRINVNTSMGHPWHKSKKQFLHATPRPDGPDDVDFGPEIWEEVRRIEGLYAEGKRAFPVYTAHLKDEPTAQAKIDKKKTRVFTGAPLPWSLVVRKELISFIRLLQKNKFIFEAAPGTCAQSDEWTRIYEFLVAHGVDQIIGGDYGKYDKRMVAVFILGAFRVIYKIHLVAGYTLEEAAHIMAIGYDVAFPVCNFGGDIMMFHGTNPSGWPGTVVLNSLVNSLYMRYSYCVLNPEAPLCVDFKLNVNLMTYGDDNGMGVSALITWFNHTAIQSALATIGVEYTMADKTAESRPYISIQEFSFLKRTWRMEPELGLYVCPLEEESIHKSLTVWLPSRTIDKYAQMVAVITSANNEYFFYGRQTFEKHRCFFQQVLQQEPYSHYVGDSTLPTWDDLIARFRRASTSSKTQVAGAGHGSSVPKELQSGNNLKTKETSGESVPGRTDPLVAHTSAFPESNTSRFQLQSEEVSETTTGSSESTLEMVSQTVTFIDNAEGEVVMAGSEVNAIAKVDGTADLQLGSFLGRPTSISSFTWTTSDTIGVKATIKPWYLYLNNATIKKKIDNFAFMRGKLHIKVMVNGTPFQYGLMRTCYYPLLGLMSSKIRTTTTPEPLLTPYSQQPGFFITPAANAGGQMELPFFYHKNWLDITSATDVQNFGTINFVTYAPLGVAVTGGSTSVTVQVFAWMTDVELMGSTSSLSLQSDEYDEGVVSKPASAIANVASYLTKVPIIGPFARATQIGATAVGSIAKIFGFTNVPVIENVHGFQPMNAPMLASGHIGTPVQKLTLDPKQELSLDPTLHGLHPQDELSIPYIKDKESYFGSGTWSTSNNVDDLLFCARITPALYQRSNVLNSVSATVGQRVYHTPCSYMGAMFYNWRGSMVIRIKVVATKFHKGRLKISYDPRADITSVNPDVNTVYTHIVDIGEEDDIEIEIPYHQDTPWLLVDKALGDNWNTTGGLPNRVGTDNGVLTVRVLTTLTAPATGSVKVLAFTRGGDDFEFANPSDHIGNETNNRIPSLFALQAEDITSVMPTRYTLGQKSVPHPERYAQNFGEAINSLRCLLHRHVTHDTVWLNSVTADNATVVGKTYRIMPYTPGFDPAGSTISSANKVVAATGNAPYAFNTMIHMPYVAGMFLGYRGGANFVITPGYDAYGAVISDVRVTRWTQAATNAAFRFVNVFSTLAASATQSARMNFVGRGAYLADGTAGMAITNTNTNGTVSVQLPDFKLANFSLADPANYVAGSSEDGTDRQAAFLTMNVKAPAGVNTSYLTIQTQVAAAPDFTCLFWLCCPTLDYLTGNPTPI